VGVMEGERGAYGRAGILSRLTYNWVAQFIAKGNEKPAVEGGDTLHEHDADYLLPAEFDTYSLRAKLHKHYRGSDEDDVGATARTASEGAGGTHHAQGAMEIAWEALFGWVYMRVGLDATMRVEKGRLGTKVMHSC